MAALAAAGLFLVTFFLRELRLIYFLLDYVRLASLLVCCIHISYPADVAALLQSPLITSNAGVAEAACRAVRNLAADNEENRAKLGAAGVCEGEYPA